MLSRTSKTRRFFDLTQLALSFASVCAVADASCPQSPSRWHSGYYAGLPTENGSFEDRRIGDLARVDRKRREAEQQSLRRRTALGVEVSIPVFAQDVALPRQDAAAASFLDAASMTYQAPLVAYVLHSPARPA